MHAWGIQDYKSKTQDLKANALNSLVKNKYVIFTDIHIKRIIIQNHIFDLFNSAIFYNNAKSPGSTRNGY